MLSITLFKRPSVFALAAFVAAPLACPAPCNPPAVVVRNCSGCHGLQGRSQLSYVPSLAGQSAKYIETKLQEFRQVPSPTVDEALRRHIDSWGAGRKQAITPAASAHMIGIAKSVSDSDRKAAAGWYAAQTPSRTKSQKGSVFEQGHDLYVKGRQAQNVPACQSCHGPEGQGTAIAPRLAGQQAAYVLAQLNQFRLGSKAQSPMTQIARSLEQNQVQAIAAYLHSR